MATIVDENSIEIVQDVDEAISVMHDAAKWLEESGKNPNKWWQLQNMNRDFLLKHAEPNEFYVALKNGEPAASVILQDNERNQSWKSVDGDKPQKALYIHWLSVSRKFAGKNLPKVIIDFAADQARGRNIRFLRLDTDADEAKLREIYESLGFKLMGIEQEDYQKAAFYQKIVG